MSANLHVSQPYQAQDEILNTLAQDLLQSFLESPQVG